MTAVPARVRNVSYAERLDARGLEAVDLLVVHCTELPDLSTARRYAEEIHYPDTGTGNCGHFYVDRDGGRWQYAPLERVAHHVSGLNRRSVGVELVNRGRYPDWYDSTRQHMDEPYPPEQIEGFLALTRWLTGQLPRLRMIAGHEELDRRRVTASDDPSVTVARKRDPGPLFPWDRVLAASGLERVTIDTLPPAPDAASRDRHQGR